MTEAKKLSQAEVKRDETGSWLHPDLEEQFGEDEFTVGELMEWLKERRLKVICILMEYDNEVLWDNYCNNDDDALRQWEPETPEGHTLLSIGDSEDGPIAMYAYPGMMRNE